ncbi:MAG: CvpA family protein [Myxococcales bacterium]|nr:CvpA family protein [Myxococcales bacterium]
MWIDIAVVAIVLVWGLFGLRNGFWSQVIRLGLIVGIYFVAPFVARRLEAPIADHIAEDAARSTVEGLALIAAVIGLYAIASLTLRLCAFLFLVKRPEKSSLDRAGGMTLGIIKGTAFSYLVLCGLVMVGAHAEYSQGLNQSLTEQARDSRAVEWVEDANLLEAMGYSLPSEEELRELIEEVARNTSDEASQMPLPAPASTGIEPTTPTVDAPAAAQMPGAPGITNPYASNPTTSPYRSAPAANNPK